MKNFFVYTCFVALLATAAGAHEGHQVTVKDTPKTAPQTITVTGQIIDPVCFLAHDASGPDHRSCAQACAKMGINLAFYNDQDHQIYMIRPTGHADPNEKVVEFAEKHVEITGLIYKFPGYQGIEVQSIKELGEGRKISLQQEEK